MATRIRLQRKGRKGKPIYSLVIADQRSPRDGKFIEKVGSYNPNTNPATINIDFDKCHRYGSSIEGILILSCLSQH